jgi:hypothetical protein
MKTQRLGHNFEQRLYFRKEKKKKKKKQTLVGGLCLSQNGVRVEGQGQYQSHRAGNGASDEGRGF